jgi:U-box domain
MASTATDSPSTVSLESSYSSFAQPKRHHTTVSSLTDHQLSPQSKRSKKTVEDTLRCPFSLALPIDPVTAEDGQVYEREHILRYFHSNSDDQIKSPMTQEIIGKRLFPAPRTKKTIQVLIENGVIKGDLAKKCNGGNPWNKPTTCKTCVPRQTIKGMSPPSRHC